MFNKNKYNINKNRYIINIIKNSKMIFLKLQIQIFIK